MKTNLRYRFSLLTAAQKLPEHFLTKFHRSFSILRVPVAGATIVSEVARGCIPAQALRNNQFGFSDILYSKMRVS